MINSLYTYTSIIIQWRIRNHSRYYKEEENLIATWKRHVGRAGGHYWGRGAVEILFQGHPTQVSLEASKFAATAVTAAIATVASLCKSGTKKGG